MKISLNKLKKLKVVTESGDYLGRVKDLILDIESQCVKQYLVYRFLSQKYLIDKTQIVSIEKERIIVEDSIIKTTGDNSEKDYIDTGGVEPIAMRKGK